MAAAIGFLILLPFRIVFFVVKVISNLGSFIFGLFILLLIVGFMAGMFSGVVEFIQEVDVLAGR